MNRELLNQWVDEARTRFHQKPPSGWLLGWDPLRFHAQLAKLLTVGELVNLTGFDYKFCNSYNIRLPILPTGSFEVLNLRVSFIVDAYVLFWVQYEADGKTGGRIASPVSPRSQSLEEAVREFIEKHGFKECDGECYSMKVEGVTLELGGDNATLGKCLFEDYEG